MIGKKLFKRIAVLLAASLLLTSTFTACKSKPTSSASNASSSDSNSAISDSSQDISSSEAASVVSITAASAISKATSKAPAPVYNKKSVFNSAAKQKESKISINNSKIVAPSIASSAPGASIIKRTQIEGVDGSFIDPVIKESPRDLGGKRYTLATFWPTEWTGGKTATKDAQRCADTLTAIQKDYNCKIKILTLGSTYLKDVTTSRTAGKVYADIFELQCEMNDLFRNGNCANLISVNSVDVKGNQWNPVYTLVTSYKSNVYGVGLRYDQVAHEIILFNKKLAAKYNLGNFYDMVDKGQWTDDTFLQVSQQFQKVNTDKSVINCVGLFPEFLLSMVYTNWTSPFGITDQKYIFNGTDPSVLNILDFAQTFVKDGLYDTTIDKSDWLPNNKFMYSMNDATYSMGKFENSKAMFLIANDMVMTDCNVNKLCKDDFGIVPLPKGPSADNYSAVIWNVKYFGLLAGDPELENAGALLTAIANRTNVKTADITANNATMVRDQESINMLINNCKYKQILNLELCASVDLPRIYEGAAMSAVIKQQSTPKQAMDSISKSAQAAVDVAYGQTS